MCVYVLSSKLTTPAKQCIYGSEYCDGGDVGGWCGSGGDNYHRKILWNIIIFLIQPDKVLHSLHWATISNLLIRVLFYQPF